ncbi:MAG: hypothetical protein JOZ72_03105 [Alphaproteobacteria bacterium]|nr:hypothetical protein [Alphaproteobacteria bacterium]
MSKSSLLALGFVAAAAPAHAALVISSAPSQNVSCGSGVCTGVAGNAVLNVSTLMSMLASGDVVVNGGKAHVVAVDAQVFWSSGSKLTLNARDDILIDQSISITGTGGLAMTYGESEGKHITYADDASIAFWDTGSSLVINSHSYTLVNDIAGLAAHANGYVALAKSYDAAGDGTYAHAPIAQTNGTLDGLGNTISNFSVGDATEGALVGFIGFSGGPVSHLRLTNVNVTGGDYTLVGGLAGMSGNVVYGDSVSGQVTVGAGDMSREAAAGGMVGVTAASISKLAGSSAAVAVHGGTGAWIGGLVGAGSADSSHASGTVTSDGGAGSAAGGLVGHGAATTSYATGNVSGAQYDGGLIGYGNRASQVDASGSVSGPAGASVGGVMGYLDGSGLSDAFATGTVTGGDGALVGGLVGENNGVIEQTYAEGAVSATGTSSAVGGLIGLNRRQVTYSYATGPVSGAAPHRTGGLIGVDSSSEGVAHIYTYWDMTTSHIRNPSRGAGNIANDPDITGLTHAQLRAALPNGFSTFSWGRKSSLNGRLPYLLDWPPH